MRRTPRRRRTLLTVPGFLAVALLLAPVTRPDSKTVARAETGIAVYAVGDVSCAPTDPNYNGGLGQKGKCAMLATSNLVMNDPEWTADSRILLLGDGQYETGSIDEWTGSYANNWGRSAPRDLFAATDPAIGNHEYQDLTPGGPASGYRTYWGPAANWSTNCDGQAITDCGYYSFDIGPSWHAVALNTACNTSEPGRPPGIPSPCDIKAPSPGNTQEVTWLNADLVADTHTCEIAFGHHPRWSSKQSPGIARYLFNTLYNNGVDLYVNGHLHMYERMGLMDKKGNVSPVGVREITVGTGGHNVINTTSITPRVGSEALLKPAQFGVLRIVLMSDSYTVEFLGTDGTVLDGPVTTPCH